MLASLYPVVTVLLAARVLRERVAPVQRLGIVLTLAGVVLIVGVWLLTGLYVLRANREFDDLTAQILAGVKK